MAVVLSCCVSGTSVDGYRALYRRTMQVRKRIIFCAIL
jgi:hypothetical protein